MYAYICIHIYTLRGRKAWRESATALGVCVWAVERVSYIYTYTHTHRIRVRVRVRVTLPAPPSRGQRM